MNIDRNLVARAMDKAGEEPITTEEWEEGTGTRVRLIKDVYHASILEALSNTDWTCQKKRARLELAEEENLSNYMYMYLLPIDCAKPSALRNEGVYLVEGEYLYTDTKDAVLIYITDNFTGKYKYEVAVQQPVSQEEFEQDTFYVYDEETDSYSKAEVYEEGVLYYHQKEEDYYFYDDYHFDPLLTEYIETILAQKIVLKLTGDTTKYQLLYSEARLMENRAVKASVAHGHNKDKGNSYWGDTLGLPNYGGN